jgi:hypothetical protein
MWTGSIDHTTFRLLQESRMAKPWTLPSRDLCSVMLVTQSSSRPDRASLRSTRSTVVGLLLIRLTLVGPGSRAIPGSCVRTVSILQLTETPRAMTRSVWTRLAL